MPGRNGLYLEANPGWDTVGGVLGVLLEGEYAPHNRNTYPTSNAVAALQQEDRGWIKGGGASNTVGVNADRTTILQQVRWVFRHIAWGVNIVRVYTFLTVGEGLQIEFASDAAASLWSEIAEENRWETRHKDIVLNTYLLGEWFTHIAKSRETQSGWKIRGIEPLEITKIDTDPYDIETVNFYLRELPGTLYLPDTDRQQELSPDEIIHTKVNTVGNDLRGTPILFTAMRYLRYCEKFLQSRHFLNLLRARLPVIRKVLGTASEVNTDALVHRNLPPPGTIIFENQGNEWQFPELNVEGAEAKPDFRNILLAISASVSLPEYLVTGDASNANYSSTLVAEAPMVRFFQDLQSRFCSEFRRMIRLILPNVDVKVTAPPVIRRKIKDIADALSMPYEQKVVSKETYREKLGLNHSIEDERVRRESAEEDHEVSRLRHVMTKQQPDALSPGRAEAS